MQSEAYLAIGLISALPLGWVVASRWVADWLSAKEVQLQTLSAQCEDLLRQVEALRDEERRVRPRELLDESTRASDEIDRLRRRLRELGLYDGPMHSLPQTPKLPGSRPAGVSEEETLRGSEWWREQP